MKEYRMGRDEKKEREVIMKKEEIYYVIASTRIEDHPVGRVNQFLSDFDLKTFEIRYDGICYGVDDAIQFLNYNGASSVLDAVKDFDGWNSPPQVYEYRKIELVQDVEGAEISSPFSKEE